MYQFLFVSLIFYFLGRMSGQEQEVIKKTKKQLKSVFNKNYVGAIDYPSAKQQTYEGSEQEKIDKQMVQMQREKGIIT